MGCPVNAVAAAAQAQLREYPDFAGLSVEVIPDVCTGDVGVLVRIGNEQFGRLFKRREWGNTLDSANGIVELAVQALSALRGAK